MTPEDLANCAASGRYWYMRPDGTFYGVGAQDDQNPGPLSPDDIYLLDASDEWRAQWESWDAAVEALSPLFEDLDQYRETP